MGYRVKGCPKRRWWCWRDGKGAEYILFSRTPAWWLTVIYDSSSRGSDTFSGSIETRHTVVHRHAIKTCTHLKAIKEGWKGEQKKKEGMGRRKRKRRRKRRRRKSCQTLGRMHCHMDKAEGQDRKCYHVTHTEATLVLIGAHPMSMVEKIMPRMKAQGQSQPTWSMVPGAQR